MCSLPTSYSACIFLSSPLSTFSPIPRLIAHSIPPIPRHKTTSTVPSALLGHKAAVFNSCPLGRGQPTKVESRGFKIGIKGTCNRLESWSCIGGGLMVCFPSFDNRPKLDFLEEGEEEIKGMKSQRVLASSSPTPQRKGLSQLQNHNRGTRGTIFGEG